MNAPGRSGIPKVIGILMIIFGSLGILFGLVGLGGGSSGFKTFDTMNMVFNLIGLAISVLHLVGGIAAVRYKANAPGLCIMYGAIRIVHALAWAVIVYAWLKPAMSELPGAGAALGAMVVLGILIGVAWPIVVLALMSRPAAKAACTN